MAQFMASPDTPSDVPPERAVSAEDDATIFSTADTSNPHPSRSQTAIVTADSTPTGTMVIGNTSPVLNAHHILEELIRKVRAGALLDDIVDEIRDSSTIDAASALTTLQTVFALEGNRNPPTSSEHLGSDFVRITLVLAMHVLRGRPDIGGDEQLRALRFFASIQDEVLERWQIDQVEIRDAWCELLGFFAVAPIVFADGRVGVPVRGGGGEVTCYAVETLEHVDQSCGSEKAAEAEDVTEG